MIEALTFRLAAGSDEAAFLMADRRVQNEFMPEQPGFLRRTTARGTGGEWIVIVLWGSHGDADAALARAGADQVMASFSALADPSTVDRRRYDELD